jgi:hypothetical protein
MSSYPEVVTKYVTVKLEDQLVGGGDLGLREMDDCQDAQEKPLS